MSSEANNRDGRADLVRVASTMLRGEIHLLEGVRQLCMLRLKSGDPESLVFQPLRAIDSETDHYPLGQERRICDPEYLARMDEKLQRYLADAREDILASCREIVSTFS